MKRKILSFLFILLFIAGFGLLAYPTVSNEWNNYVQSQLISDYEATLETMTTEDYSNEWAAAESFNANITTNEIYSDVFGTSDEQESLESSEYYQVLNVNGDGIMGYLSIPKINLKLSIYHGTLDSVLQTGLGHLNGTSLPIGGASSHSVIAGHRGLPSAELLTNIDQLEAGDKFYIHILDKTLAYEVDQVLDMVPADDMAALTEALAIEDGKDYVTLFTCTPYGVNTHRLLVRGTAVEYLGEDEVPTGTQAVVDTVKNYYMLFFIAGLIIAAILIFIISRVAKARAKAHEINETNELKGDISERDKITKE